jgi:hypothetical protein
MPDAATLSLSNARTKSSRVLVKAIRYGRWKTSSPLARAGCIRTNRLRLNQSPVNRRAAGNPRNRETMKMIALTVSLIDASAKVIPS